MVTPVNPPTPKQAPYIWVTWLAPLIDGANHCHWATWFQANYKFDKSTDEDFFAEWRMKHESLLNQRVEELQQEGYDVYVEDENSFKITGKDKKTVISGKADIVAIRADEVIVEDCKTGRKRSYDHIQVLMYMMLLAAPGGPSHCRGKKIEGRLIYNGEVIDVPSDLLTADFKDAFRNIARMASGTEEPRKTPSARECRYCKVPAGHCSERFEEPSDDGELEEHDLF
ncbi:MAG: PD-(D/E)XK nuclease family protein [Cyanobacteria bacterium J06638_20]